MGNAQLKNVKKTSIAHHLDRMYKEYGECRLIIST